MGRIENGPGRRGRTHRPREQRVTTGSQPSAWWAMAEGRRRARRTGEGRDEDDGNRSDGTRNDRAVPPMQRWAGTLASTERPGCELHRTRRGRWRGGGKQTQKGVRRPYRRVRETDRHGESEREACCGETPKRAFQHAAKRELEWQRTVDGRTSCTTTKTVQHNKSRGPSIKESSSKRHLRKHHFPSSSRRSRRRHF